MTAQAVARLVGKPGNHLDGEGLYLRVNRKGGRSWGFRYKVGAASHWCGLGGYPDVSLAEARDLARECRRMLRAGLDPITERRRRVEAARAGGAPTFAEAAAIYIEAHRAGWKSAKHSAQWQATLGAYAFPTLGAIPVSAITTEAVLGVLRPIWTLKPETASRLRGRIEAVLDAATARGWRTGENPARWRGHLDQLLPARSKVQRVEHHPALPWRDLPALIARLRGHDTVDTVDTNPPGRVIRSNHPDANSANSANSPPSRGRGVASWCLEWVILTACRSGEARGARWSEIDLDGAVWTVPASRMKAGRDHRVPLSDPALTILRVMEAVREHPGPDALIFPGGRPGRPLSDVGLAKALRAAGGGDGTVHGLRSGFRGWCAEATNYPREVAEAALAHSNKDRVEAAYLRGDHLDRRRRLMADWAAFLDRDPAVGAEVGRSAPELSDGK